MDPPGFVGSCKLPMFGGYKAEASRACPGFKYVESPLLCQEPGVTQGSAFVHHVPAPPAPGCQGSGPVCHAAPAPLPDRQSSLPPAPAPGCQGSDPVCQAVPAPLPLDAAAAPAAGLPMSYHSGSSGRGLWPPPPSIFFKSSSAFSTSVTLPCSCLTAFSVRLMSSLASPWNSTNRS